MNTLIFSTGITGLKSISHKRNIQAPALARGFFIGTTGVPLLVGPRIHPDRMNSVSGDMAYLSPPLYQR